MFKKKINKGIIGRPLTWIFAGLPLKETFFSDLKQKKQSIYLESDLVWLANLIHFKGKLFFISLD